MIGFYYNHSTDHNIRINVAYKNTESPLDEFYALKSEYGLVCEQHKHYYPTLAQKLSFEQYEDTYVVVVKEKDYKNHIDLVPALMALQVATHNMNLTLVEDVISFRSDPVVGVIRYNASFPTIEVHTMIFNESGFFSNEIYTSSILTHPEEFY